MGLIEGGKHQGQNYREYTKVDRSCMAKRINRIKQADVGDESIGKKKRPKTRWKDNVMWDIRSIGVEAMSRVVWRRVAHRHCGDLKRLSERNRRRRIRKRRKK